MIIPIIVPLYKSYHIIEKFIKSLELEKKLPFQCFFLDNEFQMGEDNLPRIYNVVARVCAENNFDINRYECMVSSKNELYSESVNMLVEEARWRCDSDTFIILNPDCFPLKENWLTDFVGCWSSIKRGFDKNICTLGALQWGNEQKTQVWHAGCNWKPEEAKVHPLDWQHIHHIPEWIYTGAGTGFYKVSGNTGAGLMVDLKKFLEVGGFDSVKFPHYSSDAYFCQETEKKGWTHYCSSVEFYHKAGSSVLR